MLGDSGELRAVEHPSDGGIGETTPEGVVRVPQVRAQSPECGVRTPPWTRKARIHMALILWLIAVFLVISGIISITRKQVAVGIALIVVGLLVGPGGVSVFT